MAMNVQGKDFNEQDVMFARGMIEHHNAALKMTIHQWHMGKNQAMKDAAMKMFTAQKTEIEAMRKWLTDKGVSETPDIEDMSMMK